MSGGIHIWRKKTILRMLAGFEKPSEGLLQQVGTPEEIYHKPQNAFVADFYRRK